MPFRDGTGPFGMGPRMGRKRGWCRNIPFGKSGFGLRRTGIITSIIPVAAAVIKDLSNHNGLLRTIGRKFIENKKTKSRSGKPVEAKYTIVEEKRIKEDTHK